MNLGAADRATLERWVRSRTQPVRVIARARIVLTLASGLSVAETAARLKTTPVTVRLWARRYESGGLGALVRDRPGRGRKPAVNPETWSTLVETMSPAMNGRALARAMGVSASTVSRWRRRAPACGDAIGQRGKVKGQR